MSEIAAAEITTPNDTSLPGVNVMLMGPSGAGKTYSIGTLVDSGYEVFYVQLDPGRESLAGYWTDRGKPIPDNLHWTTVATSPAGFSTLIQNAKNVNTMNQEMLSKMTDVNKSKYNQLEKLLNALNNFQDERTGKSYGSADTWGTDRVLVMDNLSGLGDIAMACVVGGKPVRSQSDWGIAQGQVLALLRMLTEGCKCHFVLLAHIERETDQVLGGVKIMASSLGQKLAPQLPKLFSDVILAKREGGAKWFWSTLEAGADLKTRNLAYSDSLTPTFKAIMDKWVSRGGRKEAGK